VTNSSTPPAPILFSLADQSFARTKSVGILNVSVGLARALVAARPEGGVTFFSNAELRGGLPAEEAGVAVQDFPGAAASRWGRIWYDQVGVYRAARRFPGAWLLLPKGFASFLLPPPRGVRLACYVHDTMQAHYRQHHPRFFPRFERTYFWRGFQATLRCADLILTNSQFTAAEVRAAAASFGIQTGPVACVGIGFDTPVSPPRAAQRAGLLVLASTLPHKRTAQAVNWLKRWQGERPAFRDPVHWVGSLPAGLLLPPFPNWHHRARLEDPAYQELMSQVRSLIYFTEFEGFGMPPVEAVFRGAAPVYSDIPATREVMRGRGMAFANDSYDSFATALERGLGCDVATLRGWRCELEAELRWSDVARRVLEAMSQVTSGRDPGR
jgi:glycosyltransferase involved in cell wall biosynthesis